MHRDLGVCYKTHGIYKNVKTFRFPKCNGLPLVSKITHLEFLHIQHMNYPRHKQDAGNLHRHKQDEKQRW